MKKRLIARRNLVAIDGTLEQVAALFIRVKEKGRNAEPFELQISRRDGIREVVECNNPYCHNGGFSLGDVLREMVRSRQTDFIGTSFCRGQEGDLEIPVTLHSCETRFEVEATLQFR
jgi:hypothetical protein